MKKALDTLTPVSVTPVAVRRGLVPLPSTAAADRVAAQADAQPAFEPALRAALTAVCEELDLIGARALLAADPEPRVIWHVAQPPAVRFLLDHVRPEHAGANCERLECASTVLSAAGRPLASLEAFATPGQGHVRDLAAVCSRLAEVLARKPERDDENRYRKLFEEGPLPGWVLDDAGLVLAINEAAQRELGYVHDELAGRRLRDVLRATEGTDGVRCTRKDATTVDLSLRERHISFEGRPATLVIASVAASGPVELERDPLTGLASRGAFLQRLERSFQRVRALPGAALALLFIDVDRFRRVNNSVGSAAGDALLREMGARIRGVVPPGALASRLGADEFAVLLDNLRDPGQALRVAERLHTELQQPVMLGHVEVFSTVSVGIAFSGQSCASANDLLRDADTAMGRARAKGPGKTVLWDASMSGTSASRLHLEMELRRALERGEVRVMYQPIVSLAGGEITGFEALARWHCAGRGDVPPTTFVPIAEDAGLIEKVGVTTMRDACQQMRSLEIGRREPLTLSVNFSARQLLQPDLVDQIAAVLAETGVDPSNLRAEVTESVLVENRESAASVLRRLREMRARVFLDDFGTGYSSLSYLHDLPVDGLKIDRSFVEALRSGERAAALVRSIVALARSLDLEVVAEGVETEEQAQVLASLDCRSAQGFLFAHAVPAPEARTLLQKGAFFWR